MAVRQANPEALDWASEFRAALCGYDGLYAELRALNVEGAGRWRVAMLAAEWALSDGCFDAHEKWERRADGIEQRIRTGTY